MRFFLNIWLKKKFIYFFKDAQCCETNILVNEFFFHFLSYGRFFIQQWLTVNWGQRTDSETLTNDTREPTRRIQPKSIRALGAELSVGSQAPHKNIKKILNFNTNSTISQKLKITKKKIGKLIFYSFQHIAHFSCKFG